MKILDGHCSDKDPPPVALKQDIDETNSGERITEYEIAATFLEAFTRVACLKIAKSGFQCTENLPFNLNVYSDLDFLP